MPGPRKEKQQITQADSLYVLEQIPSAEAGARSGGGLPARARTALDRTKGLLRVPRVGQPPGRMIGVDALRGLSILLVVLGHSISNAENMGAVTGYNGMFYVNNFLYAFHMPLFFLISGYVLFGKHLRVRDRALRLLLPFFAWIPVYWFVNRYIRNFPWPVEFWPTLRQTVMEPGTGLWFLPTLFLCSMLLIPAVRFEKWRSWAGELSLLVIFIGINFIPYGKLGLAQVKYFFFYFALGYLAAKYRSRIDRIDEERINAVLLACSILFLVLFTVLFYYDRIYSLALPFSLKDLFSTPAAYVSRYSMAVLGIAFSVALIKAMKTGKTRAVFAWFGMVTMDIYVAHGLTLQITFGSGWVRVLVSCITGVFLSLALSFLVLRWWWVTAAVFLGLRRERKRGRAQPLTAPPGKPDQKSGRPAD